MEGSAVATMVWSTTARNIGNMMEGKTVRNSWPGVGASSLPSRMRPSTTAVRDGDQLIERAPGGAGLDRTLGELGPFQNIGGLPGDDRRGRGIEDGDVPERRLLARENLADGRGVGVLVAALQVGELGRSQPGVRRC